MNEEQTIKWGAIIWSAILIFVLSTLLASAAPAVYGTYIGFQTRGDMELVNAGVANLTGSTFFGIYFFAALALIAFWRGAVLAKKVAYRLNLHTGLAAGLAVLVPLALGFVVGDPMSVVDLLLQAAVTFGGAYLGAFWAGKRAVAVA
ncbi:MAG: hypothetical protein ACE5G8_00745 [Anaerolineae bacterium]